MKFRKLYISLFAFVFLLSTTSLPMSIHLCKMEGKVDIKQCEMCEKENKKSCCKSDVISKVNIKNAGSSGCCSDEVIDSTVKDNFISSKVSSISMQNLQLSVSIIFTQNFFTDEKENLYSGDETSPPDIVQEHIYLLNSLLLI